jgi:hypothetical protein
VPNQLEVCWTPDDFNYKNIIFENLRQGTPEYEKKYISSPFMIVTTFLIPFFYKK